VKLKKEIFLILKFEKNINNKMSEPVAQQLPTADLPIAAPVALAKKKVLKKSKTGGVKSAKSTHPKFLEMVSEAIQMLNEKTGSSKQAIVKYVIANYRLEEKSANRHVKLALKNAVKAGNLKQIKGVGANGSFKLNDEIKKNQTKRQATSANSDIAKKATVIKPKKAVIRKLVAKVTVKKSIGESKPKKNIKKIVKPKVPKPISAAPVLTAKPVQASVVSKSKPITKAAAKAKVSPIRKPVKVELKAKIASTGKPSVSSNSKPKVVARSTKRSAAITA